MALITGNPLGEINAQDDIYTDGPPSLWFQDVAQDPLNNPDGDGFYWGITGSSTYPAYEIECTDTVAMAAQMESNPIRCDTTGDAGQIQKVNSIDITFNLKTLFPLTTLTHILRGGTVTVNAGATEKMGIGQPNNNQFWRVYGAQVYDETAGDYFCFTGHRAQFVDAWTITYSYGVPNTINVLMRVFADASKPADQLFMTLIRADPSAI